MQQKQIEFPNSETACTIPCVSKSYSGEGEYDYLNNKNFVKDAHKHKSCDHELTKDEIWVGNTDGNERWTKGVDIPKHLEHLKSVRLGEQAYCIEGKPLSRDYCRPLIIGKYEYDEYNRIYAQRMSLSGRRRVG